MTTVSILKECSSRGSAAYRAVSGDLESVGKTPGEALDAITSQLTEDEAGTIVIVQRSQPDRFFSSEQRGRLAQLMSHWREVRDGGGQLAPDEQAELDALIRSEMEASGKRAEAITDELIR